MSYTFHKHDIGLGKEKKRRSSTHLDYIMRMDLLVLNMESHISGTDRHEETCSVCEACREEFLDRAAVISLIDIMHARYLPCCFFPLSTGVIWGTIKHSSG